MVAVAGVVLVSGRGLRNRTVAFYVDNSNCRDALVDGLSDAKAIDFLIRISSGRIQHLGIWACFEIAPHGLTHPTPRRDTPPFLTLLGRTAPLVS